MAHPVEAEIVSPYCGILINTSVGNPTILLERFLRNRQVFRLRRRRSIPGAFIKEPRAVFLLQTSPQPFQPQVLAPKVPLHRSKLPHHVRTQPSRSMSGLLRYRGGYRKASGGQIPDRGDPPQASCSRTGYSDPKSGEQVVFISHFLRGLGFALHPFVRGLMFYYGLDFHDLATNSFLHFSAFIITCEAFL